MLTNKWHQVVATIRFLVWYQYETMDLRPGDSIGNSSACTSWSLMIGDVESGMDSQKDG
jgi:hypothetical protein